MASIDWLDRSRYMFLAWLPAKPCLGPGGEECQIKITLMGDLDLHVAKCLLQKYHFSGHFVGCEIMSCSETVA